MFSKEKTSYNMEPQAPQLKEKVMKQCTKEVPPSYSEPKSVKEIRKVFRKINVDKPQNMSWGYGETDGPANWCHCYPIAKEGKRQSPIDIVPKEIKCDEQLKSKPFQTSYKPETDVSISNTGASVKVQITQRSGLTGGPLEGHYRLEQFHLHWGSKNNKGSEHTFNGRMYDAELHLVHWNADKYKNFGEAADKPDGLAVLGYFIQVGKEHAGFKTITDLLARVEVSGNEVNGTGQFNPSCLLKDDLSRYWTYLGSLTTPPLYESVTWIVFDDIMEISQEQMDRLRSIKNKGGNCIVDNYRPPVSLCGRSVRASFVGPSKLQ